ncbi:MAG: MotA/TolQ/ExbB proton channel family protein [Pseudomonadota bacterium]
MTHRFPLKALGAAAALGLSLFASSPLTAPAEAQGASSLGEILDRVRRDSSQLSADNQARLRDFQSARDEQSALLADARAALGAAEARGRALSAEFDENEARLGELQAQLDTEAGDFSELLGQFRTAAGETMPQIRASLASFDPSAEPVEIFGSGGRVEKLSEIAQARTLPTRADLDSLPKAILQEMIAQSEVKTFTASVANIGDDGANASVELARVGVFTAATTEGSPRFVEVEVPELSGSDPFLVAFGAQPRGEFRSAMGNVVSAINSGSTSFVRGPVDPSKGDLFAILGDIPSWSTRLTRDGGFIGQIILFVLIPIGIALGLFKIVTLFLQGTAMRATAKSKRGGAGNPLAKVFATYEDHKNADLETLELKLDETILQETPKIERFNEIIKVLAAVAPLVGLLGTVVGMILTFTAITNYGAGDPQLMAGGISVALVTTVLGLLAAIPLILIHAIAAAMARGNQQILDEQAAGLVAQRAEGERRGAMA